MPGLFRTISSKKENWTTGYVKLWVVLGMTAFILASCDSAAEHPANENPLFSEVPTSQSGIDFVNKIQHSEQFNIFSYRNFYNGAGAAIGDINNDGLADIYLTRNQGENKLFLNKGNLQFEDVTEKAGVGGTRAWSTGVVMVDINHDGWLDLYVCNAGYVSGDDQENELFINNGDLTFSEKAEDYQLNENGYTTHAAFFDYDLDGDLDCYVLNNSFMPVNTLNYSNKRELNARDWPVKEFLKGGGDKLLRNDNGKFSDVSEEAGIYSSLIGFGLGVTVGDVNGDNLPDLYISNDFFERDYLYVNQGDGTFREEIKNWMEHLSLASMGTDMADINNDGYPEIFATEMLPESDYRRKTTMLFEDYNVYNLKLQRDFYHQYMQNTLQLNNQDRTFSEIAWYSGVAATDWSWGALMFDANNDGYRDIYVCNGVYQDVTDQDFINFFANEVVQQMALTGEKEDMDKIIANMPSNPLPNKFFLNNGDLTFTDAGLKEGFEKPTFSNGAAYGDLDNDGDLDLIVNNLNQASILYENHSNQVAQHHYLAVELTAPAPNNFAVGAKVFVHRGKEVLNQQLVPSRGFQSSVDYRMIFGLGKQTEVDSLEVIWPDKSRSVVTDIQPDTLLVLDKQSLKTSPVNPSASASGQTLLTEVANDFDPHNEDGFVDFYEEGLIIRMLSREGPAAATGDVNGDGREDVFIGSASGSFDQLYIQQPGGGFRPVTPNPFERASYSEATTAVFFDADGDGDNDLYVGAGGNNRRNGANFFVDRLYMNDGKGRFTHQQDALPREGLNTSIVAPYDMDGDGDLDLFVGNRSIPGNYGLPARSYLLENNGKGMFTNVSDQLAPSFQALGMVTDAAWVNVFGDEKAELVIIGEWMAPEIYTFTEGKWQAANTNLSDYSGWWFTLETDDVDGDGDQDLIMGNRGENFYFTGNSEEPARLWLWDFDQNGTVEKILTQTIDGKDMPIHSKKDLTTQIVSLRDENLKHTEYAKKAIQDLFPSEVLDKAYKLQATWFKSAVALNNGDGSFTMEALPAEVQFSCICDIFCEDINGDGKNDLVMGGNYSGFMPQFSRQDASFGHILINQGNGKYERLPNAGTGFHIRGETRKLLPLRIGTSQHLLAIRNNEQPLLFELKGM